MNRGHTMGSGDLGHGLSLVAGDHNYLMNQGGG